jgi:hypothetical protein
MKAFTIAPALALCVVSLRSTDAGSGPVPCPSNGEITNNSMGIKVQFLYSGKCANVCFGGARRNLFMTASESLHSVSVETVRRALLSVLPSCVHESNTSQMKLSRRTE